MRKYLILSILLFSQFVLLAQDQEKPVGMADLMRSNGKIYVVIAVILAIFTGIILYLVRLDRKISKLEKNQL
jgi:CcmD family protein